MTNTILHYYDPNTKKKQKITLYALCNATVEQNPMGRTKKYCSDDCKRRVRNAKEALKYSMLTPEERYEFNKHKRDIKKSATKRREREKLKPIYKLRERITKKTEGVLKDMEKLKGLMDDLEGLYADLGSDKPVYRPEHPNKTSEALKLVKGDDDDQQ